MSEVFGPGWAWPLLVAPFVGSFLGVLITRLPADRPIALARSGCPRCGMRLAPRDLIPLISFVALGGRCRHCQTPIPLFYPAVELAAIAVALWAVLAGADPALVWAGCGLGWTLLTLAWIDWVDFLLPDVLTLPLLLAGLTLTWLLDPGALVDHCVAAALGYLSFQGLGLIYRRLRGREGLGGGDAKLIAAAGAWCGLAALPLVVFASAVFGLLAALGLALAGRTVTSTTRIPFGPCIAASAWLVWVQWYQADNLVRLLGRL